MTDGPDDGGLERPSFRGCVFCYAGEWSYYGARTAVRRLRDSDA